MKKFIVLIIMSLFFSACEKEQIIYIADHFADIQKQYMYFRTNETDEWTVFKDEIKGFEYEEGYTYKLKVLLKKDENKEPVFELIEVLSKIQNLAMSIYDIKWDVKSLKGINSLDKTPIFSIQNEKITGNTSCNTFSADFQLDHNNALEIENIITTKRYCEKLMSTEKAFLNNLRNAKSIERTDNKILFKNMSGEVVLEAARTSEETTATIEKTWYLTSLKGAALSTENPIHFTIKDKQISGNNSCNTFGGEFISDGKKSFKTEKIRKTMRFCQDTDQLERTFHENLSKVTSYKIQDDNLLLLDESGYIIITASTDEKDLTTEVPSNYTIEYKVFSPNLAYNNKVVETENTLYRNCLLPEVCSKKELTLSKTELSFFKEALEKLDFRNIENLKAPSENYKQNLVPGATLIISYQGKTYRVPTFDHGNAPLEISEIVKQIEKLSSE